MYEYWWGNIKKAVQSTYITCPTCPMYNSVKPVPGHFKVPNGQFEVWEMYFI